MTESAAIVQPPRRRLWRSRRFWLGFVGVAAVGGGLGFWLGADHILPEYSPENRGRRVAESAACFSCHGRREIDAAFNPRLAAAGSPGDAGTAAVEASEDLVERVPRMVERKYPLAAPGASLALKELHDWIALGTAGVRKPEALKRRAPRLLAMPAYAGRLAEDDIDDLVVFVALLRHRYRALRLAEHGYGTTSRGEQLARRHGCFHCHGELGQGGIANPGSAKGYIPGFFGRDFEILTEGNDRAVIEEWIRAGISSVFIEQSILGFEPARYFTERQAVKMPAYGELLDDAEIGDLVDYCLELQELGPLTAARLVTYQSRYAAPAPAPEAAPDAGPDASAAATSITDGDGFFLKTMKPLLERHCVECHGPDKQDNDYRLDRRDLAIQGGVICEDFERQAMVPGDAAGSLAVIFLEAEEIDEDAEIYPMPPRKKREALKADEVELFKRWIDSGLPWPDGVALESKP